MKKQSAVILLSALVSGTTLAMGPPVAHQFPTDQPIDPTAANANFQELADRVHDVGEEVTVLEELLDSYFSDLTNEFYSLQDEVTSTNAALSADVSRLEAELSVNEIQDTLNFQNLSDQIQTAAPTATYSVNENLATRTFVDVTPQTPGECDQRNDNLTFITEEQFYIHNAVTVNSTDGIPCEDLTLYWDYSDGMKTNQIVLHQGADLLLAYDNGWHPAKGTMRVGESWGTYNARTISIDGGAPIPSSPQYSKMTLISIEDVTVPAGTFSDCLLIEDQNRSGAISETRLYYFCDQPGLVRRIDLDTGRDWQLQSFTEN